MKKKNGNNEFRIEEYKVTVRQRSFSAGNDGDYYEEDESWYRILIGDTVVADEILYREWADRYIANWSIKTSTSRRKNELLNEFKKRQKEELKKYQKKLEDWGKKLDARKKLLKDKKIIPEELRDLSHDFIYKIIKILRNR